MSATRRIRWTLALSIAGCLAIQTIPVAPPRFLPELGFVDAGLMYHLSVYGAGGSGISNSFAAMPSLHVGWAVLVGVAAVAVSTSRWRWVVLAHPVLTVIAVVATANHWWLDGVVASMVLAVAYVVVRATEVGFHQVRTAWPGPRSGRGAEVDDVGDVHDPGRGVQSSRAPPSPRCTSSNRAEPGRAPPTRATHDEWREHRPGEHHRGGPMQFGYFAMPSHPPERGLQEGHDYDLSILRELDRLGYTEAWIGEHHTAPWEPHPSPDLLVAQALCRPSGCASVPAGSCCRTTTRPSWPTAWRCSTTSPTDG